eukprot:1169999-Amphidinium_carterae.1
MFFPSVCPGTTSHQKGGQAFPTSKALASTALMPCVDMTVAIRQDCAEALAIRKDNRQRVHSDLQRIVAEGSVIAEEFLQQRRLLKDVAHWYGMPASSLPELHCVVDAHAAERYLNEHPRSREAWAKDWVTRHDVVLATDKEKTGTSHSKPTRCSLHGACFCSKEGRLAFQMWTSFRLVMRRRLAEKHDGLWLRSGCAVLLLRGRSTDATNDSTPPEYGFFHVPYALLRPWVPILSAMLPATDVPHQEEKLLNAEPAPGMGKVTIVAQLMAPDCFLFKEPWLALKQCDPDLSWSVSLMQLSESEAPFLQPWDRVSVEFLKEPPLPFWNGKHTHITVDDAESHDEEDMMSEELESPFDQFLQLLSVQTAPVTGGTDMS